MRLTGAGSTARAAASMSSRLQRASEVMRGPRTSRGDGADGFEIAVRGDGEAGLEDVDAEAGELVRHAELFAGVHGAAGALLAVAEGGVEEDDPAGFDAVCLVHSCRSLRCSIIMPLMPSA